MGTSFWMVHSGRASKLWLSLHVLAENKIATTNMHVYGSKRTFDVVVAMHHCNSI